MKTLNQFITEALIKKTHSTPSKTKATIKPKDRDNLIKIIKDTIEKEGNECDLNFIDVSEITDMNCVFAGSEFNGDISGWDVSNVTNMSSMFDNSKFDGDISEWNVSKVTGMYNMFGQSEFNGDISNWDVSNVTNMSYMFYNSKFDGYISDWDVTSAKQVDHMFKNNPLQKIYGEKPEIEKGHFLKN